MQYRLFNKKLFTGRYIAGGMFSLLMIMIAPVKASEDSLLYSAQNVAENSNPWALPEQREPQPGYQQPQGYQQPPGYQQPYEYGGQVKRDHRDSQYQPSHQWQPQRDRFVTPSFLESLKKQQQQYQVMPENRQYQQDDYNPWRSGSSLPRQGGYGFPSYGSGSVNPLYDVPAVSPWGDGADVLYRGQSFPLVPGEALGGLPPMHVPSFGMKNYENSKPDESGETYEGNVFNPFTFLPD
mgnify:FL=1